MGSALIRGWAISNFSFTRDRRLFEVGLFRAFLQGVGRAVVSFISFYSPRGLRDQ